MTKPAGSTQNLTITRASALYIGALLGPGLLLLPGLAAAQAGPASILAWIALLGLSGLFAAVFSALGRRFPSAGGVMGYVSGRLVLPGGGGRWRPPGLPHRRQLRHRVHRRRPAGPGRCRRGAADDRADP